MRQFVQRHTVTRLDSKAAWMDFQTHNSVKAWRYQNVSTVMSLQHAHSPELGPEHVSGDPR